MLDAERDKMIRIASILVASILGLLILAVPAQAQDWRLISADKGGPAVFIDGESIVRTGDSTRSADLLMIHPERGKGFDAARVHLEVDCDTPRYRMLTIWGMDADGKETSGHVLDDDWEPTGSGVYGEIATNLICGRSPLAVRSFGAAPPIAEARRMMAE